MAKYLLTWNFRHIANVRILREVQRILAKMATTKQPSAHQKNSSEQTLWEDEVLREVYAERDAYAAEHGFDLNRLYQDLKSREAKSSLHRIDAVSGGQMDH